MKTTLLLAATLWAQISFAGHVTGNGGDAVVCRDSGNQITSIELLDFYEGRIERAMLPSLSSAQTVDENLDAILQRLTHFETQTATLLTGWRSSFLSEANMLAGATLVDIPDSNHIVFPSGCRVEQIAVQRKPQFPGDKRYTINKDLWDAMDSVNRAGLIMHELIYRLLISEDRARDIDSKAVRFLTSVLSAGRMDVFTFQTYLTFLKDELFVSQLVIDGHPAHLPSVCFDQQGRVTEFSSYFSDSENLVAIGGLPLVLGKGRSLYYRVDHATGIKTYRVHLAHEHLSFQLNGIEFFAQRPFQIEVDGAGKIFNLRGVVFRWRSFDWLAEKELDCAEIAVAASSTGGIVCKNIELDFGRGEVGETAIRYSDVAFNSDRQILWARATGPRPAETLEIQFAAVTGFYQRIQCSGRSWSFWDGPIRNLRNLHCHPGVAVTFFANGNVQSGGYQSRMVDLSGGKPFTLHYSDFCGDDGVRRLPAYQGYEGGRPANGFVEKTVDGPILARRADGSIVKLFGMEYIEMDENGFVTSVQPGYCSL